MKHSFFRLCSILIAVAIAAPASARGPSGDTYLVVTELGATFEKGRLAVDVAVDGKSWRWMQSKRIPVEINVEARIDGGRTESVRVTLTKPRARVWVAVAPGTVNGIDVEFVGSNGEQSIDWFEISGLRLVRARLKAANDAPGRHEPHGHGHGHGNGGGSVAPTVNWAANPTVISACGGTGETAKCMEAVQDVRIDPTSAIMACREALGYSSERLGCVAVAVQGAFDGSGVVKACKDAFGYSSERLGCIEATVRSAFEAAGMIKACKDAFGYSSERMECMKVAENAARDPSEMIRACAKSASYSTDRLACIVGASSRR